MKQGIEIRFQAKKKVYVDDSDFDLSEFENVLKLWAEKCDFELGEYEVGFVY